MPTTCAIKGCSSRDAPGFYVGKILTKRTFSHAECKAAKLKLGKVGILCNRHTLWTCSSCGCVSCAWLPQTRTGTNPLMHNNDGVYTCQQCYDVLGVESPIATSTTSTSCTTKFVCTLQSNRFKLREVMNCMSRADICSLHASFRERTQQYWAMFTPGNGKRFFVVIPSQSHDSIVFCLEKNTDIDQFAIGPCTLETISKKAIIGMLQYCLFDLTDGDSLAISSMQGRLSLCSSFDNVRIVLNRISILIDCMFTTCLT